MAFEAVASPPMTVPRNQERSSVPVVTATTEQRLGIRGRVSSFFKTSEAPASSIPKSPDGILGIKTDDPSEVANVLDYAKAKDSREAAFAERDVRVNRQQTMKDALDDTTLAKTYLDQVINRESRLNGGTGNSIDRHYAEIRVHEAYRERAKNNPEVIAAINTEDQSEIEDAINRAINNTLIAEAKADLARQIESQESAASGLEELAQSGEEAVTAEGAPEGKAVSEVGAAVEVVSAPEPLSSQTEAHDPSEKLDSFAPEAKKELENIEARLRLTEAEVETLIKNNASKDAIAAKQTELEGQLQFHEYFVSHFFPPGETGTAEVVRPDAPDVIADAGTTTGPEDSTTEVDDTPDTGKSDAGSVTEDEHTSDNSTQDKDDETDVESVDSSTQSTETLLSQNTEFKSIIEAQNKRIENLETALKSTTEAQSKENEALKSTNETLVKTVAELTGTIGETDPEKRASKIKNILALLAALGIVVGSVGNEVVKSVKEN